MSVVDVGGITCEPGKKVYSWLSTPALSTGAIARIPLMIMNGSEKGPRVFFIAGNHPRELEGTQAIPRLVKELDPKKMKGSLIAIPCANMAGYWEGTGHNPVDGLNLNRVYPGKKDGSITERMAYVIYKYIVPQVECIIDLHSMGSETDGIPTGCYRKFANKELRRKSRELAEAYGVTVWQSEGTVETRMGQRGTLDEECEKRGIPYAYSENPGAGMGHRVIEKNIAICIRGLKNIMKHLGMIPGKLELPEKTVYIKRSAHFPLPPVPPLNVKIGGFVVCHVKPGEEVKKGQKLGTILDIWANEVEILYSPYNGLVRSVSRYPVVKQNRAPIRVCPFVPKEEL